MFHLICVVPFHGYEKGQRITDQAMIAELSQDRDHHFVRVHAPAPAPEAEEPEAEDHEAI